jgi:abortive infection bacteriophage resistance protein
MKYTKPPLSFEDQAELLLSRGIVGDRSLMIERLSVVNYYRLSGYWFPFRQPDNTFKKDTSFDVIWKRYVFDRRLRLLVIDAIERIEVTIRTQLAYHHSHRCHDPFAYANDSATLPGIDSIERARFLLEIENETTHSKETFVEHFRNKYGDLHQHMPVWMASEVMTFGCLLTFFRGSHPDIKKEIASIFHVHDIVLYSWLLALNVVRNICAHHGRLWNREMGIRPKIPKKSQLWHTPVEVCNDRIFGILTICKYCLDIIAPQSH